MNGLLLRQLRPLFSRDVQARGAWYAQNGRVVELDGGAYEAEATVKGSRIYQTAIKLDETGIDFACSCPFFAGGGNCKHLWALALQAAERNLLTGIEEQEPASGNPSRWQTLLEAVKVSTTPTIRAAEAAPLIHYELVTTGIHEGQRMALEIYQQGARKKGGWGKHKTLNLGKISIEALPDARDRQILATIQGSPQAWEYGSRHQTGPHFLSKTQLEILLPILCATGRFRAKGPGQIQSAPLAFDEGDPWHFRLRLDGQPDQTYQLTGYLQRANEKVALDEPVMLLQSGWVFFPAQMARLHHGETFEWIAALRQTGRVTIRKSDISSFLRNLFKMAKVPEIDLPPDLSLAQQSKPLRVCLQTKAHPYDQNALRARLVFDYCGRTFKEDDEPDGNLDWENRTYFRRDRDAERMALVLLGQAGFREQDPYLAPGYRYEIWARELPAAVRFLMGHHWRIEASGKPVRESKSFTLQVASGTDWFDLNAYAEFEGTRVGLPQLLKAARDGQQTVLLDDGSLGLLPEEWLRRIGSLAGLGEIQDQQIRFQRGQALLLDALLAEQPEVDVDAAFARIREELQAFQSVQARMEPPGFKGVLRPYQREGLGWFGFLQRFGFGGCLADDMGLGKTVQVLALLEQRRLDKSGPSLVVAPRSLMFNWRQEAEKFTPALRVLEHSGIGRARSTGHLSDYDLILTTYGTLRRDAALLKDVLFDYVILDEAQAIKNADTHAAKAARLLRGRHRLALSGTPVENHLGELWSLFAFLNPGMMGRSSAFSTWTGNDADPETRPLLARALRPFILRRTKGQVAKELPARLEQTIHCDLPSSQRKLYDELRTYYQQALLKKVATEGLGRSKIMVLEALLRLRQAACHPGLIDKERSKDESAKLSALMVQLEEVTQEGHKALVFSQFTSFLTLVKRQLDNAGMTYEYLDGKTRDRQPKVERFQKDPDCRLFLISLRAGGLGLNLTAAEYVFLLDPWWNPAVEAQAIDRAHRIGQTQKVFAYRLIARDTIEEKVLQLQARKRDLAAAIITEDQSILRNLTREDLELLLG